MKRSRLFLWIFGILMQAFLISMHFYQRNMEAMYAETEYLLKEVLNEELHRKQQELNLFYISKVTIDTIPLTIRVTKVRESRLLLLMLKRVKRIFLKVWQSGLGIQLLV